MGRRAAVDVGTNSVRVLVVDDDGHALARDMEITRLGQGVDETGELDDEALARTLDVIGRYRQRWEEFGVRGDVRIAATSAIRDAADRERFFAGVRRVAGVDAEVLSGEEEAATAFHGATAKLDVGHPAALLDVGGGSTEIVVGDRAGDVKASISLQLGCVRLTERLLSSDPPTDEELQDARAEIAGQLDHAAETLARQDADPGDCRSLIGVAGTVTTLAALSLDLDEYDADAVHGTVVDRETVGDLTRWLAGLRSAERRELGPVAPGREDIILGGALVVEAVLDRFGYDALTASEADILDGLVARR
ncbi:MAG: Ppx/GppA family phosphatase [Actinobacteria bacterium]|nr:Ppx/GppA family phosphatase [Actinomycetota bacterium]